MISIIVPVYNAEKYIRETIESVKAQTFTDWELILVDDQSKDGSVRIIEEEEKALPDKIRLIRQPENGGAAKSRNAGIRAANGRYIAFLDADDLWYPEKLERQMRFMEESGAPFVFMSYHFGDENAVPGGKVTRVPKELTYERALSRTVIFTSTVLIDTQKIAKDLILMPEIPSEDTATWWQILRSGVTARGIDDPLVVYRRPPASLSSDKRVAVRRIWNLYRNFAGLGPVSAAAHMAVWAFLSTKRRVINDHRR